MLLVCFLVAIGRAGATLVIVLFMRGIANTPINGGIFGSKHEEEKRCEQEEREANEREKTTIHTKGSFIGIRGKETAPGEFVADEGDKYDNYEWHKKA